MSGHVLILSYDSAQDGGIYRDAIAKALPGVPTSVAADAAAALQACTDATVIVGLAHHVSQALVDASPGLRMIQALTTGTDHLDSLTLPPGITIASARGAHGPQMAELAFLFMLALSRRFAETLDNQAKARWVRWPQPVLRGRTVVVFGVGVIAEDLARRCQAFGMQVIGVSNSRTEAPGFDRIHPRAAFATAAAHADFLVVLAPYSATTHHAVDAQILAACKPEAFVINIARGGVVDEAALIQALRSGRIAGAGLDVFATEPLPAESVLWSMDRVIITPHIGGMNTSYAEDLRDLICHNVASFIAGDLAALRNPVRVPPAKT